MIVATPGSTIEISAAGFPTGLAGTLGLRELAVDGTVVVARATAGVHEAPAGSGSYLATLEVPSIIGRTVAIFDTGATITPSTVAAELIEVTYDGKPAEFGEGDHVAILFGGFPTGLVGTFGVRILDESGSETTARTTAGIVEVLAGSGIYIATVTCPAPGTYTVFGDTGTVGPSTSAGETLIVSADPTPQPYEPTVAEVAARVPSRPRNQYGRISTFTEDTQPTADQVQAIIDDVVATLIGKFGTPLADLVGDAHEIAVLRAAMGVELGYFADQIQAGRSPYQELKQLYDEAITNYQTDRENLGADGSPGVGRMPVYSFPAPGLAGINRLPGAEYPFPSCSRWLW